MGPTKIVLDRDLSGLHERKRLAITYPTFYHECAEEEKRKRFKVGRRTTAGCRVPEHKSDAGEVGVCAGEVNKNCLGETTL